jgi:hypothetical protein
MTRDLTNREKYLRLRLVEWRNDLLRRQASDVNTYKDIFHCGKSGDDTSNEMSLGLADFMDITTNVIEIIDAELSKIEANGAA